MTRRVVWVVVLLVVLATAGTIAYRAGAIGPKPSPGGSLAGAGGEAAAPAGAGQGGTGQQAAAQCAGPLPPKFPFKSEEIPKGKAGEWVELKNEEGKVALRVKVDLQGAWVSGGFHYPDGKASPSLLTRWGVTIENRSCEPFEWNMRYPGFMIGFHKPISEAADGWYDSHIGGIANIIYVPDKGTFHTQIEADRDAILRWIDRWFNGQFPREFPGKVEPGQAGYGQFYVLFSDVFAVGPWGATGPKGDGHIPMALGGASAWVVIDLGQPMEWFRHYVGDPKKPETWKHPLYGSPEQWNGEP